MMSIAGNILSISVIAPGFLSSFKQYIQSFFEILAYLHQAYLSAVYGICLFTKLGTVFPGVHPLGSS